MRWVGWTLLIITTIAVLLAVAVLIGRYRWDGTVQRAFGRITQGTAITAPVSVFDTATVASLPPVVRAYLLGVLQNGQQLDTMIRLRQTGTMLLGNDTSAWAPFTAEQIIDGRRPGYVWSANVAMMPLFRVNVLDEYANGHASMHGTIEGLIDIVHETGGGELASGALMRYAGECVWSPAGLLPSATVAWQAIDDHRAMLRMTDAGITVELEFTFDANGDPARVYSAGRWAMENGVAVQRPWDVRIVRMGTLHGRRLPVECEVAWYHGGERRPWWRGTITEIMSM